NKSIWYLGKKLLLRTPEIPCARAIGAALLVEVADMGDVDAKYELGLNSVSIL
ncbi:hypothetical protein Tco_0094070, partial [Tanacetum coccineum]